MSEEKENEFVKLMELDGVQFVKEPTPQIKNKLLPPTKEEAFLLFEKHFDDVYNSTQGQNIINELHLCENFNLKYVDEVGYDGICKKTGRKKEIKVSGSRTQGRAGWTSCGKNKKDSDDFIFWDTITGQFAEVPTEKVQEIQQKGHIKARLSDNPGGRSKHIRTVSSWFN